MNRQYPIWFQVMNEGYKSDKSFGCRVGDYTNVDLLVGTSSKNSHKVGEFRMGVDAHSSRFYYKLKITDKLQVEKVVYCTKGVPDTSFIWINNKEYEISEGGIYV